MPSPDWRSLPGLMALAEKAATNGLVFSQAKFDFMWEYAEAAGVPPLLPFAVLVQEGTGSFNTRPGAGGDGGGGIEPDWARDVGAAIQLIAGKLALYPQAVGQGFQELGRQVNSPGWGGNRCDSTGGPIEWVNWATAILRPSGQVDVGCYALHASWWLGVRDAYLRFGGAVQDLMAAAGMLDAKAPRLRFTLRLVADDEQLASNSNATAPEPAVIVTEVTVIEEARPPFLPVEILDGENKLLAIGWLMDPDGDGPEGDRSVVRVRDLADGMGLETEYLPAGPNGRPAVVLRWPGKR